jgi:hypothetical protein
VNAYTLAALPPVLLLIARPQLWPWALAVAAFVALAALGAAAQHFRNERDWALAEVERVRAEALAWEWAYDHKRDEAREELARREREAAQPRSAPYEPCVLGADGVCTRWTHDHAYDLTARMVDVARAADRLRPDLRIVAPERDGEWPRIEGVLGIEEGEG